MRMCWSDFSRALSPQWRFSLRLAGEMDKGRVDIGWPGRGEVGVKNSLPCRNVIVEWSRNENF